MADRLDGRLNHAAITELEEHLAACSRCRVEWQKMHALDGMFRSAPMRSAPPHLHTRVMARINRREQARRAVVGGLILALGATAVALLTLTPIALGLLENLGIAPTLLIGGVETITQLLTLVDAVSRMLLILLGQLAKPLVAFALGSFTLALALNGLWIVTMRRLRLARR